MKERGLLPIGTVVLLKDSTKRAMIVGLCQKGVSNQRLYDYAGVVFPEGFVGGDKMLLFDNNQIERLFALGYQDAEQLAFLSKANALMGQLRASNDVGDGKQDD